MARLFGAGNLYGHPNGGSFTTIWGFVAPGLYQGGKAHRDAAFCCSASSVLLFRIAGAAFGLFRCVSDYKILQGVFHQRRTRQRTGDDRYQQLSGLRAEAIPCIWHRLRNADCRRHSHLDRRHYLRPDLCAQKRPYIIVGCFVFGMLLTPPDVISQSLLAIPMWLLCRDRLARISAD